MNLRIHCLSIDTDDPARLADFWQSALSWRRSYENENEAVLEPPEGSPEEGIVPDLLFWRAPTVKAGRSRLHLDLRPEDQDAEVARLEGLGARRIDIGQDADISYVVMADPDGNEFWMLRALKPGEPRSG